MTAFGAGGVEPQARLRQHRPAHVRLGLSHGHAGVGLAGRLGLGGLRTASLAAFGTLAALMAREKTGRGQKVEGALLRTAIAYNNPALVEQQVIQVDRVATVNRGQTSAPSDVFRTRDGWIIE